jgi:hypothetical protein
MRSYCYGSDSDSDDDDYVPKAKKHTATPPITPSPTQTQSPSKPYPHEYQPEKDDIEPAECGYDHENEGTKGVRQTDRNRYKPERLAYEEDKIHKRRKLECRNSKVHRLGEFKCEPKHEDNEANEYTRPDHNLSPAPSATRDDRVPHTPTTRNPTLHTSHPTPANTPTPSHPLPSSPVRAMSPMANEPGHVTVSNHAQRASAFNDVERELAPANGGTLIPLTTYPTRTWCHPPLSWSTSNGDEACPCHIEDSHPLFSQHKQRRYKRSRKPSTPWTCDYHTPQSPIRFSSHSDASSTLTTVQVPVTPFTTEKSNHKNLAHQSNNNTIPYPTIRPHPPPWPIKYPDQNQNQHQHNGKITLARETTRWRPPPWPNQSHHHHIATHPIILIPPARPPPWPIIFHHSNHRNAKRCLRTKFQRISEDIFLLFTYLPFQY